MQMNNDGVVKVLNNQINTLMAITVGKISELQEYFNGVMGRADHHADSVNEIILALVGGVIWRSTRDFEVKQYNGAPANILWMYINDDTYCFKFNHESGNVEVCLGLYKGDVVKEFNNDTPLCEVKAFFEKL